MAPTPYEVTLGSPAGRRVLGMETQKAKDDLADALRVELHDGPNADKEYSLIHEGRTYTATPLSVGLVAIHRPMEHGDLKRLGREQNRHVLKIGFYVADILSADSAILRGSL
ncbi:hypothetical protein ACGFNX_40350 [Streptomyces sp. NPDC048723]|uniref:hypothetical protein n=1 Tax=unclassified Streptomyces TaxID=2593676 RepID=UPI002E15F720|nr:hypothetical protein OG332_47395 [Streptomyces sp. NBC_01233]